MHTRTIAPTVATAGILNISKQLIKEIHILILSLISTYATGQTEKESFWNPYIESDRIEIGLKHYDSLNFKKSVLNLH